MAAFQTYVGGGVGVYAVYAAEWDFKIFFEQSSPQMLE
jgi:hypothetical protein